MISKYLTIVKYFMLVQVSQSAGNCRVRSSLTRQDGGECFEIPRWQYQDVELDQHLSGVREKFETQFSNAYIRTQNTDVNLALVNSEVSRYMDTVIAPFLDTYHRNIQTAYQQLTNKLLKRIKEEINSAVRKKHEIYHELSKLANELNVPALCDEERRTARTIASKHVAEMYECTEGARASIAKMGKYAEEMINITRNHMQATLNDARQNFDLSGQNGRYNKTEVTSCVRELSRAAVTLGYELDLSLTNARRHNEQSCEKLTTCSTKTRGRTDEAVKTLREQIYHCVYA